MRRRSRNTALLALAALASPSAALAKSAVVPPFVGKTGVDSLQVLNITSLVASEVDFSMTFEQVHQLEAMPQGMNVGCLSNTTCLGGVAKANSADVLIAGSVARVGEEFEIFMVHFDRTAGSIVRKNTWRVSADPTRMADRMSSLVAEILTGKSTEQAKREDDLSSLTDLGTVGSLEEEGDFTFEKEELEVGRRVATPEISDRDLDDFELLDAEEEGRDAQLAAQRQKEAAAEAERERQAAEAAARAEAERKRREAEAAARAQAERERQAAEAAARAEAERKRQEAEAAARAQAERKRREAEALAAEEAEREREEAEAAAARAEAARRAQASARSTPKPAAAEEEVEFTFAPVSAADMGFELPAADDLITIEPVAEEADDDFDFGEQDAVAVRSSSSAGSSRSSTGSGSSRSSTGSGSSRSSTGSSSGARSYVVEADDEFEDFDAEKSSSRKAVSSESLDEFDELDELDEEDEERSDRAAEARREAEREAEREAAARKAAAERAERERDAREIADLDRDRSDRSRSSRGDSRITGTVKERQRVSVTARFGTSGYQSLQFLTYGGELAFAVGQSARIETGLEAYSVKRQFDANQCEVDPELEGQVVGCTRWNTILPLHVGARYQRSDIKVRPYVGGDLTLTPYTEDFKFAFGFRGRGGVDFVPTEVFGLNLNVGVGMLHGKEFDAIERGLKDTGLLWQVSAGTVFML